MLTNIFKPKHEYDLIRLGGNYDGGYLVERSSIEKSKSLVTLGLGYEWTFEKDYYKLYRKPIHCYDHTVSYSSIKKLSRKALASNFFRLLKPKYFTKKNFLSNLKKSVFLYKDYKNLFQNEVKHYVLRVGPGFGPGNKGILLSTDGPYDNVIKIKPPMVFNKQNVDFVSHNLDTFFNKI